MVFSKRGCAKDTDGPITYRPVQKNQTSFLSITLLAHHVNTGMHMKRTESPEPSDKELRAVVESYHPIGVYKFLCALFGDPYSPDKGVKWLRSYSPAKSCLVMGVLRTLPERDQTVLILRYGLVDAQDKTLQSIGDDFSLTRERIRQIHVTALRKLRHPTRIRMLDSLRSELTELNKD